MIEIGICSGDKANRENLILALTDWFGSVNAQVALCRMEQGQELLAEYAPGRFAFLFIDTELADGSGLDLALQLRAGGDNGQIAFLAGDERAALACYKVHPAGFFLKPVDEALLRDMLQWYWALFIPAMDSITVTVARIPRKLHLADILYISVCGRTSHIHMRRETVAINRSLNDLEKELPAQTFFRAHRGYLVNTAYVAAIQEKQLLMKNGERLPLSEERLPAARSRFQQQEGAS